MSEHTSHTGDGDVPAEKVDDTVDPGPDGASDGDSAGTEAGAPGQGSPAPETGDLVIDAALRDLAEAPEDDLDAQVERGEQVQRTLQGRLSDLGG
ncbi:hypothetical protein ACOCJ5_13735 [Knoellia sp. CPCC 206450]|uniref:hypothetical protein n=1 Tax=Knoellia tibetensis TaxID=3404798 RepID=UPI003B435BAD